LSSTLPSIDAPVARLRRTLSLWDLILYGVIVIQPTAPMPIFGVLSNRGRGHVVTTILLAMVAMIFTAISYGRMARAYPSAFYDSASFKTSAVLGGTSIAVLTYIGFDGISTLSEEVEHPRRDILLATVMTCSVIGVLSAMEVYAAQLVWPASQSFRDVDTAYVDIAARVAGPWFFLVMNLTLLVANFGSGVGAQLGAARLLYGMGRSNALPKSFFGVLHPKHRVPHNNVIFVGMVALAGAFVLSYALGAEMLNFGALIAFMGVNAAALMRYYVRATENKLSNLCPPVLGFVICLILWLSLSRPAKIAGTIWMAIGIAFGIWRGSGFLGGVGNFDSPAEDE
jgi:putrescine importer